MIDVWGTLTSAENAPTLGAISFLISVIGLPLAWIGLRLTYVQARNALVSSEKVQAEILAFQFRKQQYDAFSDASEAKAAMESAARLINAASWHDAAISYDEARKALVRILLVGGHLPRPMKRQLKSITAHLHAFSESVDAGASGRGVMPEAPKVLAAIRRNCDAITEVQIEIQRHMQ